MTPDTIEIRFSPTNDFVRMKFAKKVLQHGSRGDFRFAVLPYDEKGVKIANELLNQFHLPIMTIIMRSPLLNRELVSMTHVDVAWNGLPDYDYVGEAMAIFEKRWFAKIH